MGELCKDYDEELVAERGGVHDKVEVFNVLGENTLSGIKID